MTYLKQKPGNTGSLYIKTIAILLISVIFLASCSRTGRVPLVHQFGSYGANIAREIAKKYPVRVAGSEAEKQVSQYIVEQFKALGFVPEVQNFALENGQTSQNIIVKIPGSGFVANEDQIEIFDYDIYAKRAKAKDGVFRRHVAIGARYDSNPNAVEGSDGISDNASGIGALLLTAQTLKRYQVGYDVTLVAFGAGFSESVGAKNYLSSLSEDEKKLTDVFYEYRSLYSGAKLYGHAGWASLYPNLNYKMRQALYEIADIAVNYSVYGRTGHIFYTNQSTYLIPNLLEGQEALPGAKQPEERIVFREISHFKSDYQAFDQVGIPVVYFESYDYSADKFEEIVENNKPIFQETEYKVRGTQFENIAILEEQTSAKFLEERINVVSFLVFQALSDGVLGGSAYSLRNVY